MQKYSLIYLIAKCSRCAYMFNTSETHQHRRSFEQCLFDKHTNTHSHTHTYTFMPVAFTECPYVLHISCCGHVQIAYMHFVFDFVMKSEKKIDFTPVRESFSRRRLRASAARSWLFFYIFAGRNRNAVSIGEGKIHIRRWLVQLLLPWKAFVTLA